MSQLHSDIARMQKMFTSILKYASRNNIPIPQVTSGDLYRLTLSEDITVQDLWMMMEDNKEDVKLL